jgi:hypothetical protein
VTPDCRGILMRWDEVIPCKGSEGAGHTCFSFMVSLLNQSPWVPSSSPETSALLPGQNFTIAPQCQ